jgi:hypothetical protein
VNQNAVAIEELFNETTPLSMPETDENETKR